MAVQDVLNRDCFTGTKQAHYFMIARGFNVGHFDAARPTTVNGSFSKNGGTRSAREPRESLRSGRHDILPSDGAVHVGGEVIGELPSCLQGRSAGFSPIWGRPPDERSRTVTAWSRGGLRA